MVGLGALVHLVLSAVRVRLCMTVLPQYEYHTIVHHIAYHRLIGFDEFFIYIDDRPDRIANKTILDDLARTLKRIPDVWVFLFTQTRERNNLYIANQFAAVTHCKAFGRVARARDGYPRDLWVTNFDGDEYLAPAKPLLYQEPSAPAPIFDLKAWLAQLPVDGVFLPRREITNGGDLTGEVLQDPPTAILGDRFFEPRAYMRLLNSTVHVDSVCRSYIKHKVRPGNRQLTRHRPWGRLPGAAVILTSSHPSLPPSPPRFFSHPKWLGRAAPMDLANTSSSSIHSMAKHLYNLGTNYSNSMEKPCADYSSGGRDWLENYDGPVLFHYVTRSVSECLEKERNQAKGLAAPIDLRRTPTKQSHRAGHANVCFVNQWRTYPRVFNLAQWAGLVEQEARETPGLGLR